MHHQKPPCINYLSILIASAHQLLHYIHYIN
jgi:hypothetical protein